MDHFSIALLYSLSLTMPNYPISLQALQVVDKLNSEDQFSVKVDEFVVLKKNHRVQRDL